MNFIHMKNQDITKKKKKEVTPSIFIIEVNKGGDKIIK